MFFFLCNTKQKPKQSAAITSSNFVQNRFLTKQKHFGFACSHSKYKICVKNWLSYIKTLGQTVHNCRTAVATYDAMEYLTRARLRRNRIDFLRHKLVSL